MVNFDLAPGWPDYYFPGSEAFFDDFALFMQMPDGSSAGYWLYERNEIEDAPIVLLDSEGQFEDLAPNLECLLAGIVLNNIPRLAPENSDNPASQAQRRDLGSVVSSVLRAGDFASLAARNPGSAHFPAWAMAQGERFENAFQDYPDVMALRKLLEPYMPDSPEPWESQGFQIYWAGDCVEVAILDYGPKPFDDGLPLIPHFGRIRTEAAEETPGLGLWHSALFSISGTGWISFRPNYIYEPEFLGMRPSAKDFQSDQDRFPRNDRRIPPWLLARLQSSR